jgi:DNA-binding transcriptional regulator GbsR (MarR family)
VTYQVSPAALPEPEAAEDIRREFAAGWGRIGGAWGVAPSTAAVQGYLLAHGGPLTEADLRAALGLSHRATLIALAECESWGLIEQVDPRRVGRRGPAARAWVPVGSNWQWFQRVAAVRKERETDPVLPLLDQCRLRAQAAGAEDLRQRLDGLVTFVHLFDRSLGTIVRTKPDTVGKLFRLLGRLDERTTDQLLAALGDMPDDELYEAARALASLPPGALRRMLGVAGKPAVLRLLGVRPAG